MLEEIKAAIEAGRYVVPARILATEFVRTYYANTQVGGPPDPPLQLQRVGGFRRLYVRPPEGKEPAPPAGE